MWTPDIDRALTKWYLGEGKSLKQCAELIKARYGVTFSNGAVSGRVHKLKIQKGRPVPAPEAKPKRSSITNLPITGELAPTYKPKVIETAAPPLRKTLMQLKSRECVWPVTAGAPHFFCGHRTYQESRYCETHHKAAHEGGPKSAKDLIRSAGYYR